MTRMDVKGWSAVADAVAAVDWGRPTAAKRGRNPRFPYVPVIDYGHRTQQVLGVAYADRAAAVAAAEQVIRQQQNELTSKLTNPRFRALREHHGLPRELTS